MSYFGNTTHLFPNNSKTEIIQNNQLMNNQINYVYPNITSQSVIMNKGNLIKEFYADNNINNFYNTNNLRNSFNGNMIRSKSLISSGKLKISRRNQKYNRVIKNGKKLKNIDLNRDYDEEPENEDDKSSINSSLFKNKLASKVQNDSLNKNASEQLILNNQQTNTNIAGNNISNIQQNSIINSLNNNNNLDDISKVPSNNLNNNGPEINKSKNQYLVSKQENINILVNKNQPIPLENIYLNNPIYNSYLGGEQPINPYMIYPEETNNSILIDNFDDYIKNETLSQPFYQEEINEHKIGIGFKFCSKLSKAGANAHGIEKTNQDTPLTYISVANVEGFNIFGVLDGHGSHGHFVSQFCRDYFMNKMKEYTESLMIITQQISAEDIYINLKSDNFSYINELFLSADNELSAQNYFDCRMSGTTCNLVFQFNTHLICFNVGDSRSILIEDSGDGTNKIIRPLSIDHKPDLPEELNRICSSGGVVDKVQDAYGNKLGPNRVFKAGCVYPGLAMSRSLGDLQAKECGVISKPQITEYEINENTKYFVICSDGIWEFLWNEQVRDIGNAFYNNNDVAGFCTELVNVAVSVWGDKDLNRDDITVVAVFL